MYVTGRTYNNYDTSNSLEGTKKFNNNVMRKVPLACNYYKYKNN